MGKRVNLALQGGGAHGAFGWGVLDRLAEDGRLEVEGLSAASAGSVNAVVFAQGLMTGGNAGARVALEKFWKAVSEAGAPYAPATMLLQSFAGVFSPYQFNPFNVNPLRQVLEQNVDMHAVRACDRVESDEVMCDLTVASKLDTNWEFLCDLRDRGRLAAAAWLDRAHEHIGQRSTVDLRAEYLGEAPAAPPHG